MLRDEIAFNCTYFYNSVSKFHTFLLDFLLVNSRPLFCLYTYRLAGIDINASYLYNFEIFFNVADAPVHLNSLWKKSSIQFFSLNRSLVVCQKSSCFLEMPLC